MSERTANAATPSRPGTSCPGTSWGLARFLRDTGGATAIEYAMIGGLIFAVIAGSLKLYGSKVDGVYGQIGNAMAQVN
ncbi:Flp family type IVb pilin [Methylobacterium sp. J-076]|uniref:Flp family type IVb pilin n=1 Tax=Methylobacterium sp. J-076 TaxID=2836655 RepID=UPI001FBA432E|nr:Flp family type IVb pilin [Methylobacterium sp. J-076]MCJ2011186.1 Flp family type IVb pilin [Methylobacterium sp. J-076]